MKIKKLGPDVLLKIVEIVQLGLVGQTDVSQDLRDLEMVEEDGLLCLVQISEKSEIKEL